MSHYTRTNDGFTEPINPVRFWNSLLGLGEEQVAASSKKQVAHTKQQKIRIFLWWLGFSPDFG